MQWGATASSCPQGRGTDTNSQTPNYKYTHSHCVSTDTTTRQYICHYIVLRLCCETDHASKTSRGEEECSITQSSPWPTAIGKGQARHGSIRTTRVERGVL